MSLVQHLIAQIEAEAHASRRVIERIPTDMYSWKPHEKSMSALDLATHIANLVGWGSTVLTSDELDFASEEAKSWKPSVADDIPAVLAILDEHVGTVKGILEGMSDADLEQRWTMRMGEQIYSEDPRASAFAHWVISHQSHHRGQLVVYLRMNDIAVPGIFGPSADEKQM